jgi:hypothetical protein
VPLSAVAEVAGAETRARDNRNSVGKAFKREKFMDIRVGVKTAY